MSEQNKEVMKFVILGEPCGKGRPRFTSCAGHIKTHTPEKTVNYETLVKTEFSLQCKGKFFPQGKMLEMVVFAFYSIAKSDSNKEKQRKQKGELRPTKKPDWDNVGKIIADSLNGIAYHDDSQIVDAMFRKFYSDRPRVEVLIREAKPYTPEYKE